MMSGNVNWKNMLRRLVIITLVGCSLILVLKNFFIIGKRYNYNMNVSESIDLDKIYKDDESNNDKDLNWETSDDNIVIEDSVVIAKEPGKAKVVAKDKKNNKVRELLINVLDENDMAIDNHNVNLKLKQYKKIFVNNKYLTKSVVANTNIGQDKDFGLDNNKIVEELSKIYPALVINEKELFSDNSNKGVKSVIVDEEITDEDIDYEYESSDESVAVVDDEGNIETVSSGDAIVTVTDNRGNEDYMHVVVDDEDIDLYTTEYNLNVDEYVQVEYKLNSISLSEHDIKWSSDDTSIAVVDNSGVITAVNSGSTYININVGDTIQKKIHVNVLENLTLPEELDISLEEVNLKIGDFQIVSANVYPYSAYNKEIVWKSDNDSIATVNNGVIRAVGYGEAIVSATTVNGIRREIKVVVGTTVQEVEEVKFSQHSIDMNVDEVKRVSYDILPDDAIDKAVRFYYDNNYIEVDDSGNVKALKTGSTILTITTSNGKMDTMVINIKGDEEYLVKYIEISKNTLNINVEDTSKLEATLGNGTENDELVWTSSNDKIVSVDQEGNIKGINSGSAIIYVYLKSNSSVRGNCYVSVKTKDIKVSKVKLNTNKVQLTVGDSKILIPTIEPANATDKKLKWVSSNEKVVKVDSKGSVKAIGAGSAVVKVMANGNESIFASCEVIVKAKSIVVNKITLDKSSLKLTVGDSNKLSTVITPSNATDKSVKWSSSNSKVVTVDGKGNLKAVGVGSANVKVVLNSNTKITASCSVVVKAKDIQVNKMTINKSSVKLLVGKRDKLVATVYPSNATNKNVLWKSSNTKVVLVNQLGEIKGVGAGSAKVVAVSKSNGKVYTKTKITVVKPETNKQKFIKALDSMANQVKKDGNWHYGGMSGTFASVRKRGRRMDCATYVSHALMEVGIINSKSRFYKPKSNTIRYIGSSKSGMQKHLKYINGNGKKASTLIREGKLQKGDIVLWYNKQHTNAYAGNKKWYDAGRWSATGAKNGHRFKTIGPVSIGDLNNNWRVWRILRFKD